MKHRVISHITNLLWLSLLLLSALLTGCMFPGEEYDDLALRQAELMSNQIMHYRPVHHEERRWVIYDHGNTLALRTGMGVHLKTNARRNEKRTVIRKDGQIIGNVITRNDTITFQPLNRGPENAQPIHISCDAPDVALLQDADRSVRISFDSGDTQAQSPVFIVRRFSRRKLSIEPTTRDSETRCTESGGSLAGSEHCGGTPVEAPFNALGTLLFNSDDLPLNARFALASYVTSFHFRCR